MPDKNVSRRWRNKACRTGSCLRRRPPPLPVAWTKTCTGAKGKSARIFTTTMGHCGDLKCENLRRLLANACYWCMGLEDKIPAESNVGLVGQYAPNPIHNGGFKKSADPSANIKKGKP